MIDIRYKKVEQVIEKGELSQAEQILEELGSDGYNDSAKWREYYLNAIYKMAAKYCETGDYITGYDLFASLDNYNNAEVAKSEIAGKRLSQLLRSKEQFDTITFGQYEQENGMEDIEWYVLDKQDDRCLLFSTVILDFVGVRNEQWENSVAREWMNSTFYETAFNSAEKEIIINATLEMDVVYASDNFNPVNTGRVTSDKVFAISLSESQRYHLLAYPVNVLFYSTYSYERFWGAELGYDFDHRFYLLRTPFYDDYSGDENAWMVSYSGLYGNISYVDGINDELDRGIPCGVRPAIWVKIE